jgi:small GTP-binding protein
VVLIGEGAVGKTSLRREYMGESFKTEYMNTVGADFAYYSEKIENDLYKWSIWDLAGQPKFENVRPMFYAGAFGALLCFDSTRIETFHQLDKWVNELVLHTHSEGTPIVIVATKIDIYEEGGEGHVNFTDVDAYVEKLRQRFNGQFAIDMVKTSAKEGVNIKLAFSKLREAILQWQG